MKILTNRLHRIWNRLARGETALHQAVIENDLISVDPELLDKINGLGFTPRELALLLNRTEWYPALAIIRTNRIKIAPKGEHLARAFTPLGFEEFFGIPYLSQITFTSYDLLKITISQCPWLFRSGMLGMEDNPLYPYFLDQIYRGSVANVTIGWIDAHLGYGVFANEHLEKGAFVGAYTGAVRPVSRINPDHNEYCLHYPTRFWSRDVFVIDAGKGGNEIRFVNHSDTPNLSLECLYNRGLLHFFLRANQPIGKGSHLTFNYGEAFWQYRPFAKI